MASPSRHACIEGGHVCLKQFLGTGRSDLFGAAKAVDILHAEQYDQTQQDMARSCDSMPRDVNASLLGNR